MATLEEIKALLGEPRFQWSDPEPWNLLEQELGVSFPADFRAISDAYGPVLINDRLRLDHPGHPFRNRVRRPARAPAGRAQASVRSGVYGLHLP